MKKNPNFEEALSRLEEIAGLLENGELSLEESLKLYEEGSRLAAQCSGMLTRAQQKIIELNVSQSETADKED